MRSLLEEQQRVWHSDTATGIQAVNKALLLAIVYSGVFDSRSASLMLPPLLARVNYGGVGYLCLAETVVSVLVAVFFMYSSCGSHRHAAARQRKVGGCGSHAVGAGEVKGVHLSMNGRRAGEGIRWLYRIETNLSDDRSSIDPNPRDPSPTPNHPHVKSKLALYRHRYQPVPR